MKKREREGVGRKRRSNCMLISWGAWWGGWGGEADTETEKERERGLIIQCIIIKVV